MYNSNVQDSELTKFHNKVKANLSFELAEMMDNPLFIVEEITDTIYKIIPLFNCDSISSSNEEDRILDNKCIICIYKADTIFNFISNNEVNEIGFILWVEEKYGEAILIGIVYDTANNNPIMNVNLSIDCLDYYDRLKEHFNLITDKYGGFSTVLKNYHMSDRYRVIARIDDIVRTYEG